MKSKSRRQILLAVVLITSIAAYVLGPEDHGGGHEEQLHYAKIFLFVVLLGLAGRIGAIVERWKLPEVLGQLIMGILVFNVAKYSGFAEIQGLRDDQIVQWVAFGGVLLLLFKTGLEENLQGMLDVGSQAALVAVIGVVVPFVGAVAMSFFLFPEAATTMHIFLGATLVATSVGITSKVFDDLKYTGVTKRLVIGAAVIDDVIGLIVLAVVSVMAAGGVVSAGLVVKTTGGATAFLILSCVIGVVGAPLLGGFLSRIHTGVGMKSKMALVFAAAFAYAAIVTVGLEPIVGAFAAGLVLTHTHFSGFDPSHQVPRLEKWMNQLTADQGDLRREMAEQKKKKEEAHVEHLIEGVARFFVPVFFVHIGMKVDVAVLLNLTVIGYAAIFSVIAILGKLACGLVAGKANKIVTGWAMVARGEVGIVFASTAQDKKIFNEQEFAIAIAVVVATTFIAPLVLSRCIRKERKEFENLAEVAPV